MLDKLNVTANGQLQAPMEPGYAAFKGAFGGWTAAHALLAAQSQVSVELQPAALSIDFLGAVGPGQVTSTPTLGQATRSAHFVSVQTAQLATPRANTSVLLALRRPTERIDAVTMPACPPAADLPRWTIDTGPNTWVQRFEMRCAHGRLLTPNVGLRSLTWTRLDDTSPSHHATVAAMADASFPRIYFHFAQVTPIATVTMSVHFHADEAELADALSDFVLVEASGHAARHGFFDQHVRIWSGAGALLATSTQLARYDLGAR